VALNTLPSVIEQATGQEWFLLRWLSNNGLGPFKICKKGREISIYDCSAPP